MEWQKKLSPFLLNQLSATVNLLRPVKTATPFFSYLSQTLLSTDHLS